MRTVRKPLMNGAGPLVAFTIILSTIHLGESFLSPASKSFAPPGKASPQQQPQNRHFSTILCALPDIESMKAGDVRKELESYGISTKSFLERKEMAEALTKARAEGKKPEKKEAKSSTSTTVSGEEKKTASDEGSRQERLQKEIEKANSMKVGELKKELESRGVSTKSFFEKSEFVRAYAEAVVDGVKKGTSSSSGSGPKRAVQEEDYDPSYRDVVVQKFDRQRLGMLGGTLIDITL